MANYAVFPETNSKELVLLKRQYEIGKIHVMLKHVYLSKSINT